MKILSANEREVRAAVRIAKALRGASVKWDDRRWRRALYHGCTMSDRLNFAQLAALRTLLQLP